MNKGLYGIPKNRTYQDPISASYALTASYALNGGGGGGGDFVSSSWTGSNTSQFYGTASYALTAGSANSLSAGTYSITASWAQSASNAINSITASLASTASYFRRLGSSATISDDGSGNIIHNTLRTIITGSNSVSILAGNTVNISASSTTISSLVNIPSLTSALQNDIVTYDVNNSGRLHYITASTFPIRATGSVIYSIAPVSKTPNPTTDDSSIFLGSNAGLSTGAANENSICIGTNAGSGSVNLRSSINIGPNSGAGISNQNNISIGNFAGSIATNALNSHFIGNSAGRNAISASYANFIGYYAGSAPASSLSVSSNNIIIGTGVTLPSQRKDSINIGGIIFGTGSIYNIATIPVSSSAMGRIGVNVITPTYPLDVSGSLFSGSVANFSSDIVVATRSAAPGTGVGVEGQIVPVNNAGIYLLYVYIGGRWRSSSLF